MPFILKDFMKRRLKGEYDRKGQPLLQDEKDYEQAARIFDELEAQLKDNNKKIGLLYSANNNQALAIHYARKKNEDIPVGAIHGSGQAPVFQQLAAIINHSDEYKSRIQIFPIATSMRGGDNVRGNQVGRHHLDRDLLAIAEALASDEYSEMIGTPEVERNDKGELKNTGFAAIGGQRSSRWKTDTSVYRFQSATGHRDRKPSTQDAYTQYWLMTKLEPAKTKEDRARNVIVLREGYRQSQTPNNIAKYNQQQLSFFDRVNAFYRLHPKKAAVGTAILAALVIAGIIGMVIATVASFGVMGVVAGSVIAGVVLSAKMIGIGGACFCGIGLLVGGGILGHGIKKVKSEGDPKAVFHFSRRDGLVLSAPAIGKPKKVAEPTTHAVVQAKLSKEEQQPSVPKRKIKRKRVSEEPNVKEATSNLGTAEEAVKPELVGISPEQLAVVNALAAYSDDQYSSYVNVITAYEACISHYRPAMAQSNPLLAKAQTKIMQDCVNWFTTLVKRERNEGHCVQMIVMQGLALEKAVKNRDKAAIAITLKLYDTVYQSVPEAFRQSKNEITNCEKDAKEARELLKSPLQRHQAVSVSVGNTLKERAAQVKYGITKRR